MLFWICLVAFIVSIIGFVVGLKKDWRSLLFAFTVSMMFFGEIVILTVFYTCIR